MNRSGWSQEQIELRGQLEAEGKVEPYEMDDEESLAPSDEYMAEDDYWDETFQGGEDGGENTE
eukprot:2431895-Alexandrium_andersonii.AAC.1